MDSLDKDPWVFSYRADTSEDNDSNSDCSAHEQSAESRLWLELDISSRKDTAVYKPNPFSIAKLNAIARSSAASTSRVPPVSLNPPPTPKKSSTIKDFFRARQKTVQHPKHSSIPPASMGSEIYPGNSATVPIMLQPISPPAAMSLPQEHSCSDAHNYTSPARIIDDHAHTLTKYEFSDQSPTSSTHVLSPPIVQEYPSSVSKPVYSLPVSIYATRKETIKSQLSARKPSALGNPNSPLQLGSLIQGEKPIVPIVKLTSRKENVSELPVSPVPQMLCSRSAVSTQVFSPKHPSHKVNNHQSRAQGSAGASLPQNALQSTRSLLKGPSGAQSKAPRCYDFGQNADETWSTLPPPKKRFKPSIQHGPKNKTSGPFRILGLGGNALVRKTGINTTSATRVITFLPTPLPVNDPQREIEENVIDIFQPLSSPPSSPISFDPDDETEELKIRLSSPPTSDPVQDDGNMKLPIDLEEIKRRYLHVPQKAKEVGLVFI